MAVHNGFISGVGIAIAATTLALSPRARRAVGKGTSSAVSWAISVGETVARGTRNLQEEQKHVTRFGAEAEDEERTPTTGTGSPAEPPASI